MGHKICVRWELEEQIKLLCWTTVFCVLGGLLTEKMLDFFGSDQDLWDSNHGNYLQNGCSCDLLSASFDSGEHLTSKAWLLHTFSMRVDGSTFSACSALFLMKLYSCQKCVDDFLISRSHSTRLPSADNRE